MQRFRSALPRQLVRQPAALLVAGLLLAGILHGLVEILDLARAHWQEPNLFGDSFAFVQRDGAQSLLGWPTAQHNEHRIVWAKAASLFETEVLKIPPGQSALFQNLALLLGCAGLWCWLCKRLLQRQDLRLITALAGWLLLLNPWQYENLGWEFQTPWFLINALVLASAVLLSVQTTEHSAKGSRLQSVCALLVPWIALSSTGQGLAVAVAFVACAWLHSRRLGALASISTALAGLLQLDPATQSSLIHGLTRLPAWLPAILAVLAVSYAGRYWRFRLLLNAETIGRSSRHEAWLWFQGFALTATPGKLGELARVQQLHQQLGYPRSPLLQAFLAERLCDVAAVVIWLAFLVPGQWQERLSRWKPEASWIVGLALLLAGILILRLWRQRSRWRHHLPSRRLGRACLPATAVSLAIWGLEAMILLLLVQAIEPSVSINPGQAISIYLLSGTAGMASLLPGGVGVNEAATTLLLQQVGIPSALALSIAILRRLCSVWLITALAATAGLTRQDTSSLQ